MSQSALNPQQFFHGTTADLKVGDEVKPSAEVGTSNYPRMYEHEPARAKRAYATSHEPAAWYWGNIGSENMPETPHDVNVYKVEAQGPTSPDRAGRLHEEALGYNKGARSSRVPWKVTGSVDIPHPSAFGQSDDTPIQGMLKGIRAPVRSGMESRQFTMGQPLGKASRPSQRLHVWDTKEPTTESPLIREKLPGMGRL